MIASKNPDPACAAPTKLEINRRLWADASNFKPPQDGTPIAAVGRVIVRDGAGTYVDNFVSGLRWEKDDSGFEGWHFIGSGLTVARNLDEEVKIDWWNPLPAEVV